jgi:hypothetical protein
MTSLTTYLLVILIVGIILLTITYTTDFTLPIGPIQISNFFDNSSESSSSSSCPKIEYEKNKQPRQYKPQPKNLNPEPRYQQKQQQHQQVDQEPTDISNFLIDNSFDSDNINKQLFNYTEDFQMTENTGNVIADALAGI